MNLARPEVAPCGRCLVAFVAEISQCRDAATAPIVTKWGGNRLTTMARRIGLVRQMERCTHLHTVRVGVCAGSAPRDPDWTGEPGGLPEAPVKCFRSTFGPRSPKFTGDGHFAARHVHHPWAKAPGRCGPPINPPATGTTHPRHSPIFSPPPR